MHKHELIFGKQQQFQQHKKIDCKQIIWEKWMLHAYSHKQFIFELRIIKLRRKMILQQTPSSGTHPPY